VKKKVWIGFGIAAVIIVFVAVAALKKAQADEPVSVTQLGSHVLKETFTTSGLLEAGSQQAVYFQPERGELEKIWVKPGQKVKKGDRLIEYENPQLLAEKEQAEVQIKTAKVKLRSLYRQKRNAGSASRSVAGAGQPGMPPTGSSKEEINQQIQLTELELEQAEKQLEVAKSRVNNLVVTSKVNGTVVQVDEQAGSSPSATNPVVVVADLSQIRVTANISEYDVLKVKEGQPVKLESDALPDQKWDGVVEQVAFLPKQNQPQGVSGSQDGAQVVYPVKIKVNQSLPVKIGSKLIVEISTSSEQVMGLPQAAVIDQDDQSYVFVVEKGEAVKKPVKVGKRNDQVVQILSGVSPQDDVIVSPPKDLAPGMEVKVR